MSRVVVRPEVMSGKPVVEGTRITVELILEELGAGMSVDELVSEYPSLTVAGVRAALVYAARVLRNEDVFPLEQASK